tara:strand:+ start:960 stop:1490 length:531 start_codon:yes stop_codon:yes gene_type:complete
MLSSLIIYSSTDGHTINICKRIINFLGNHKTQIMPLDEAKKINLSDFSQIIIGASIRYGRHSKELYKFIDLNKNILNNKKSIFFSVNVVARKSNKNTADTNPYIKKFLKISKWKPFKIGVFAGKIDYPRYGFFDKHIIRLIMYLTDGPTDLSKTYEFTDWDSVDLFAKEIANNADY